MTAAILTLLANLFGFATTPVLPPCEDATGTAMCVMYDERAWTVTTPQGEFTYPTRLCASTPVMPCLVGVDGGWVLVSTGAIRDVELGA